MLRKKVKVLTFPDMQILDIAGPVSVFESANAVLPGGTGYDVSLAASKQASIASSGCIAVVAHETFDAINLSGVNTILVPGGSKGTPTAMRDKKLRELIQAADERKLRIASICTGAFILAEAGVLDGRKCTTHWSEMGSFRRRFPDIGVLTDVIYHNEDHIWTSAGVSTGIDMSLAMVAEDFGDSIARKVARNLVLYMARPGTLDQISEFVSDVASVESKMEELVLYIKTTPAANHQVSRMAERCNMSARNFTRKFKDIYGQTPAAMVREVRVQRTVFYMQTTNYNQKRIASLSGFSSVDVMRQAINAVRRSQGQHCGSR